MIGVHNSLFEDELRKLINDYIGNVAAMVIAGLMSESEYRRHTGIIGGLKIAIDLCDEANSNLAKR